jgi:hypothetical protein
MDLVMLALTGERNAPLKNTANYWRVQDSGSKA